jgi:hypothetical protein
MPEVRRRPIGIISGSTFPVGNIFLYIFIKILKLLYRNVCTDT